MGKGYENPWTIRPAPMVKAFIDGVIADGTYRSRSDAVNHLLDWAIQNIELVPTLDPVSPESEDYVAVKVPMKAAIYLEIFAAQVSESLDSSTRIKNIDSELLNIAKRKQELATQKQYLEERIERLTKGLGSPKSARYMGQAKIIESDTTRLNRIDKLISRLEANESEYLKRREAIEGPG